MNPFFFDFLGFSGTLDLAQLTDLPPISRSLFLEEQRSAPAFSPRLIQLSAGLPNVTAPIEENTRLLLAGCLTAPATWSEVVACCTAAFRDRDMASLSCLEGDFAGCYISSSGIFLFKSAASTDTVFYQRDGTWLRWSTNPSDLVEPSDLDNDALYACCAGEDAFIYRLAFVRAGTVVCLRLEQEYQEVLAPITSAILPPPTSFHQAAVMTREALLEATAALARSGKRIGVLLSGGIDSSALTAALVLQGAEVAGYHFDQADPSANEADYARAVCQHLSIPFVPVRVSNGEADYLRTSWRYAHVYGHAGYRWFEQVAERLFRDDVHILVTGRGGDPAFGPGASFGLRDILTAPLPWHTKQEMLFGAVSTDWLLPGLLKSLFPGHSLISESVLSRNGAAPTRKRPADFLAPAPAPHEQNHRAALDFSPRDLALELSLWKPFAIRVCHPYHHHAIQTLSASLPAALRLLPYKGMKIVKPVLRLACVDWLPPSVVRHRWGSWLDAPGQSFCINFAAWLQELLGSAESEVVRLGIVDPIRLRHVLNSHERTRENYATLLATAMTELFLRQAFRGGNNHATYLSKGRHRGEFDRR
jgi:hypothetical protein